MITSEDLNTFKKDVRNEGEYILAHEDEKMNLNRAKVRQIIALQHKKTAKETASLFGVTKATVINIWKNPESALSTKRKIVMKEEYRNSPQSKPRLTRIQKLDIYSRRNNCNVSELAAEYGVSLGSIYYHQKSDSATAGLNQRDNPGKINTKSQLTPATQVELENLEANMDLDEIKIPDTFKYDESYCGSVAYATVEFRHNVRILTRDEVNQIRIDMEVYFNRYKNKEIA